MVSTDQYLAIYDMHLSFVCVEFSLRLVNNTANHYEGRVEVYYSGQWGTICSYFHSNVNARIICQELGYPDARAGSLSASFGTGIADQPIWLSYLFCQGTETSIADCYYYLPWDVFTCSSHSNDLSVSCVDGQCAQVMSYDVTRISNKNYNY